MGLTIHWSFRGPTNEADAHAVVEKMRQRALDLPFESVSEAVHFVGEDARYDRAQQDDEFLWLKVIARQIIWNKDVSLGRHCFPKKVTGFLIDVAPGADLMGVYLASYPKTIMVKDERTGKSRRLPTGLSSWCGSGFCKTQYASHPDCGGIRAFLRAHLSVCRLLDHAAELGILGEVKDEGNFFQDRDVPALVNTVGQWNAFIAGLVGSVEDLFGMKGEAPIKSFPDFEHLEAKGQDKIDAWLRKLKEGRKPDAGG